MVYSILAVSGVTRAVGNEDSVEVVCDFVDWVVGGKDSDGGAARDLKGIWLDCGVSKAEKGGNSRWSGGYFP